MAKPNGYGKLVLGGLERGYLVGYEQGSTFCKMLHRRDPETGQPMSLKAYGELFNPLTKPQERLSAEDVRDFIYSALVEGAAEDGATVDFSPRTVSQWLNDADDPAEASKPLEEMYRQMTARLERQIDRLKNDQAPKPRMAAGHKPKKAKD